MMPTTSGGGVSAIEHDVAKFNVGGQTFQLSWRLIVRNSCSLRLSRLYSACTELDIRQFCDEYDPVSGEFFFDRHPESFESIMHLIKFGVLYHNSAMCVMNLVDDLEYWGIDHSTMPRCCRFGYDNRFDESKDECDKVHAIYIDKSRFRVDIVYNKIQNIRSQLWALMEDPESSKAAKIMTVISIFFIVVSTCTLVVSSVPASPSWQKKIFNVSSSQHSNQTAPVSATRTSRSSKRLDDQSGGITDIIELICIIWFTVEYLIRLSCCARIGRFLLGFMNIVDLIAIVPFYLCAIINAIINNESMSEKLDTMRQAMQLFRVLRVLRILKFARHSVGLQSLGYTLRKSYNELGMLLMFIGLGSMLFSSLVYFAERDEPDTKFTSILATNWWAIISMTTVGYGDMSPETTVGQIVGSICCVSGVLIISMPIPIIVNNFGEFYQDKMRVENTINKREQMEIAMRTGCVIFENDNISSLSLLAEEEHNKRLALFHRELDTLQYIDEEE